MDVSQTCNNLCATSLYRSEYEVPYHTFDRQHSSSPPPSSPPLASSPTSSWGYGERTTMLSKRDSSLRHSDFLHVVLGNPRVAKAPSARHHRHHNSDHYEDIDGHLHGHEYHNVRDRPGMARPSLYSSPRSNSRPPSLIDRIKAALETPNRSSSKQQQQYQPASSAMMDRSYFQPTSPTSPQPPYSNMAAYRDENYVLPPPPQQPTLFGVRCTEISQRAYTGKSSEMKKSFDRLQRLDSGKVEYRTIAFCTHLTVSRWEPSIPSQPSPTADSSTSEGNTNPIPQQKNDPARLMSLANYIRHVLSLTAGVPSPQPQPTPQNPQRQDHDDSRAKTPSAKDTSAEDTSSGTGPIKTGSSRRHRYFPDYHDHSGRRHARQRPREPSYESEVSRSTTTMNLPQDHGHRERNQSAHQSPYAPPLRNYHGLDQASQYFRPQHGTQSPRTNLTHASSPHFTATTTPTAIRTASQSLLKVQFPNLTLTLALIYVDRLKAKYPEAKGEPGCSHRLFLVAFIIAAKYRCSVELSRPLLQDSNGEILSEGSEQNEYNDRIGTERVLEARLNAELIFSNHAWVRLLNLGSFYRQPSPSTTPSISTLTSTSPSTQSSEYTHPSSPARSQTIPSTPRSPISPTSPMSPMSPQSPQTNPTTQPQLPSLASIIHSTSSTPSILQVEDLDRMEAEFLTFLDLDLATMSHDLETCWNLLVGKVETSS